MRTSTLGLRTLLQRVLALGLALGLVACGGGRDAGDVSEASAKSVSGADDLIQDGGGLSTDLPTRERTAEVLRQGAELNRAELKAAEDHLATGKSEHLRITPKAFAGLITAFRFFNSQTGAHFYTVSTAERDSIIATLPQFVYEGPAFSASSVAAPGLSQVHRFFNRQTGVHFYTISQAERTLIQQTLPQFQYEGVAYYASTVSGTGLTPLNRFYVNTRGFHFYSNSQTETNGIRNNPAMAHYVYEGVGYYVLANTYEARPVVLPHTGISTSSCFALNTYYSFVACDSDAGRSLYQSQDGHRTAINPMSYSEVAAVAGGTYPRTDCVRDNVTGLVWEGKNVAEPRSGTAVLPYANIPAYVTYVNSIALCGYTNWRLPTVQELQSIVHFGVFDPSIDTEWFPNARPAYYWSSTASVVSSSPQNWTIRFNNGTSTRQSRTSNFHVRLVRNAP